ncbi:MAG: hypothetical protein MI921_06715 [Cytophagales bacterium]|nr:hypothetical protein [Cytophagales bacterium]
MKKIVLFIFILSSWRVHGQVFIGSTPGTPEDWASLQLERSPVLRGFVPSGGDEAWILRLRDSHNLTNITSPNLGGLLLYNTGASYFNFWDQNARRYRILNPWVTSWLDQSGVATGDVTYFHQTNNPKVGIGTASPENTLEIAGKVLIGQNYSTDNTVAPDNGLRVEGEIQGIGMTPPGGVIMFHGETSGVFDGSGKGVAGTPYEGWAICNGQNGTPDLRGRFIVGVGRNEDPAYAGNTTYLMGGTGGEEKHTLTQPEMPAHNHNHPSMVNNTDPRSEGSTQVISHSHGLNYAGVSFNTTGSSEGILVSEDRRENLLTTRGLPAIRATSAALAFTITSNGGDQPHENRPPYYALAYIMRLNP